MTIPVRARFADGTWVDYFDRPDGAPGNGWTDAATIHGPTYFDTTAIVDGDLHMQADVLSTFGGGDGNGMVGHYMIARDLGLDETTDWEVSVMWEALTPVGILQQVTPCAFVDLNASDPEQMGVGSYWDVSLPSTYLANTFRDTPISDVFDPSLYTSLAGSGGAGTPPGFTPGQTTVHYFAMRCVNELLTVWLNGSQRGNAVAVPAWAEGRTWFGIHTVAIDYEDTWPSGYGSVTHPTPAVVQSFCVREL